MSSGLDPAELIDWAIRATGRTALGDALPSDAQRILIHNEQTKLLATVLNIVTAGLIVTGIVAPLTSAGMAITGTTVINDRAMVVMGIWMISAIILHCSARLVLRNQR